MADRQVSLGQVVKLDHDDDASFDAVGLITSVSPPPRTRQRVNAMVLGDSLETDKAAAEAISDFTFTQLWHPGDTEHEKIDTLFDSKAEREWQLVTPHSTPVTDEFTGVVMSMDPSPREVGNLIARDVTVHRVTAITRT